jgi:hypothetical protein
MAVKLTHLQLIYGVAGAREKFEELIAHLIRSERPDTERIRIVRGDGGIDAHEGNLTEPAGVDVYQIKFFPDGIGDSQKAQIRDSFNRVRESNAFTTKSWTLCLPIDMSLDEKKWFDGWKENQSAAGIDIRPVWSAFHLEGLLYMEKNRYLREAFFQEEHLKQIRDMHSFLHKLLDDFSLIVPKPIEMDMVPKGVKVLKSYKYPDFKKAVIDLEVHFQIKNLSTNQTCRTWEKKVRVSQDAGYVVNRGSYPVQGFASYILLSREIAPTCAMRTEVHFGLKVTLDQPIHLQLEAATKAMQIHFNPISENLVGSEKTVDFLEIISFSDLMAETERSLREAGIDFRP